MLKFTSDHEWILIDNDTATVGITQFAQEKLGDLVFVELPKPGAVLEPGLRPPLSNPSRPPRTSMRRSMAK